MPAWAEAKFDEGFWGPEQALPGEPGTRWTHRPAEVRVEAGADQPKRIAVRLSADSPRSVVLTTGGQTTHAAVGPEPAWFTLDLPDRPHDVDQQRRLESLRGRLRR